MLISHKGSDESILKIFSKIPKDLTEKREPSKFCWTLSKEN